MSATVVVPEIVDQPPFEDDIHIVCNKCYPAGVDYWVAFCGHVDDSDDRDLDPAIYWPWACKACVKIVTEDKRCPQCGWDGR